MSGHRRIVTLSRPAPGIAPSVVESLDRANPRSTQGAAPQPPPHHPQVQQESDIWAACVVRWGWVAGHSVGDVVWIQGYWVRGSQV